MYAKDVKLNSLQMCQVRKRRKTKQFAHASSGMTLNYNVRTRRQVGEGFKVPSTLSANVRDDDITMSTSLWKHETPCNTSQNRCMGLWKDRPIQSTYVSRRESSENGGDSPYRVERHKTKDTFRFTTVITSMLPPYNAWLSVHQQCADNLASARGLWR